MSLGRLLSLCRGKYSNNSTSVNISCFFTKGTNKSPFRKKRQALLSAVVHQNVKLWIFTPGKYNDSSTLFLDTTSEVEGDFFYSLYSFVYVYIRKHTLTCTQCVHPPVNVRAPPIIKAALCQHYRYFCTELHRRCGHNHTEWFPLRHCYNS